VQIALQPPPLLVRRAHDPRPRLPQLRQLRAQLRLQPLVLQRQSPRRPDGLQQPRLIEQIASWARETYRLAEPDPVAAETCLYTTTPDETFILERRGRIVIGSPCSGHGFKFAPAIGERLAELATG